MILICTVNWYSKKENVRKWINLEEPGTRINLWEWLPINHTCEQGGWSMILGVIIGEELCWLIVRKHRPFWVWCHLVEFWLLVWFLSTCVIRIWEHGWICSKRKITIFSFLCTFLSQFDSVFFKTNISCKEFGINVHTLYVYMNWWTDIQKVYPIFGYRI